MTVCKHLFPGSSYVSHRLFPWLQLEHTHTVYMLMLQCYKCMLCVEVWCNLILSEGFCELNILSAISWMACWLADTLTHWPSESSHSLTIKLTPPFGFVVGRNNSQWKVQLRSEPLLLSISAATPPTILGGGVNAQRPPEVSSPSRPDLVR